MLGFRSLPLLISIVYLAAFEATDLLLLIRHGHQINIYMIWVGLCIRV